MPLSMASACNSYSMYVCELFKTSSYNANACAIGRFCLVYWPEEVAVSVVSESDVVSETKRLLEVGSECVVKVQAKKFNGIIAASGKLLYICTNKLLAEIV